MPAKPTSAELQELVNKLGKEAYLCLQREKSRDELEMRVAERTFELEQANKKLRLEIEERKRVESELKEKQRQSR